MDTDIITTDEIRTFVGSNTDYYIHEFSKFTITGTEKFCLTWNWSTFGFTFLWMLYRKMYIQAVVTFLVLCIPGINILLHIIAGLSGNYIYYRNVKSKILDMRAIHSSQNYYTAIQVIGGVNKYVITAGIVFTIVLVLLLFFFFATIISFIENSVRITI